MSFVLFLQVFVIGFASVQIIVGHRGPCAKQTKHYIRDFFFVGGLVDSAGVATESADVSVQR